MNGVNQTAHVLQSTHRYIHIHGNLFRTALNLNYCLKDTYLFGDLATVVEVVQCEDPLLLSVLVTHRATLRDLDKHIQSGDQTFYSCDKTLAPVP